MSNQASPNPIQGIGTDIIEISRIKEAIEKHGTPFLERIFTKNELAYCQKHQDPLPRYAGRFAAKEAIVKALGTGFGKQISWQQIEVHNDENGKPHVHLSEDLQKAFPNIDLLVTISHCKEYATATAIGVLNGAS